MNTTNSSQKARTYAMLQIYQPWIMGVAKEITVKTANQSPYAYHLFDDFNALDPREIQFSQFAMICRYSFLRSTWFALPSNYIILPSLQSICSQNNP